MSCFCLVEKGHVKKSLASSAAGRPAVVLLLCRRAGQSGFSLIELMISLLLGTLIILATVSLFDTNQRSFRVQQGLTDVQEQGRFAIDYLSRDLRRMGFVANATLPTPGIVANPLLEGGAGATANDSLVFSFHGRPGDQDCEGDAVPLGFPPMMVVNSYSVVNGSLQCIGDIDPGSTGVEITSGVDSFQVLYGIDIDPGDDIPLAGLYVQGNAIPVGAQVVAVRVGLLVRAVQDNPPNLTDSPVYIVLDKELQPAVAPLDERAIRRLFVTTVRARNVVWEEI